MSMQPRDAKWITLSTSCAGHERLGQRQMTSPSGRTSAVPHAGHSVGIWKGRSSPVRRWVSADTTWGITSPARCTMTVSPMRRSFRARSSWLCRVARSTVTPPTCTGSSSAHGTMAPVRPTFTLMSLRRVVAVVGANL